MNPHHLAAFLWLRWRLLANQVTRGGLVNRILLIIVAICFALTVVSLFTAAIPIGYFLLPRATPLVMLLVWDGLVLAFLMLWMIGLLAELQRSEALSPDKFLHLPVSLWGVFALNYVSSLFSLTLMLLCPTMVGLAIGLIFAVGPRYLMLLPLAAAFVFMVTAATYQFQGWLATLMQDKRRRRTIIVVITLAFIVMFQVPNLVNILRPWEPSKEDERVVKQEEDELRRKLAANEINAAEHTRLQKELAQRQLEHMRTRATESLQLAEQIAWPINAVLPIGWLPLGAHGLVDGNPLPAALGTLGMALIGGASFWRAYRTTRRLYMGGYTLGATPPPTAAPVAAPTQPGAATAGMLAWQVPWISDQAACIALACFRSLARAPEAKMLLLTPVLMVIIFGGIFWRGEIKMPDEVRPMLGFGAISMILLTLSQIIGNQFGFDRGGFRVYVLSPAPRSDILLGKNLAVLPIAMCLALPMVAFVQIFQPMRIDHVIAAVPQFISMYLLYCIGANLLSIFSPIAISPGSMKASNPRLLPILLHMGFVICLPILMAPTLVPMSFELILERGAGIEGWPICLILMLIECAATVVVYRMALTWQGRLLQSREQNILEVVTSKAE